jgi:hypothetical protein
MSFVDLVKQNDGVRALFQLLGQLATFLGPILQKKFFGASGIGK